METYDYDVDDGLPYEVRTAGGVTTHLFRHEGWDLRATTPTTYTVTEQVLPMLAYRGTEEIVRLTEPDGHALYARGSATQTEEGLGAFGLRLSKYVTNADGWVEDGLHGEEVHRAAEVVHYGARHLGLRDGMWLQPEPLLYLGLTTGDLRNPVGYSGVYAAGNTNAYTDRSGFIPVTEKGLKEEPTPETLEPSAEFVAGMKNIEAGTAARQLDPQDPARLAGHMPENSQQVVIPSGAGEAALVGKVDTTSFSGSPPPGGGNNAHGHAWSVVGPSTNSNPEFAGRPNDETTAIGVASTSPQGIGFVAVSNGPKDGTTRTIGAVVAVRTDGGIVVSRYSGPVSQQDNTAVLVRVGAPQTLPNPGGP